MRQQICVDREVQDERHDVAACPLHVSNLPVGKRKLKVEEWGNFSHFQKATLFRLMEYKEEEIEANTTFSYIHV